MFNKLMEFGVLAWGGASDSVLSPLLEAGSLTENYYQIHFDLFIKSKRFPSHLLFQGFPVLTVRQMYKHKNINLLILTTTITCL